MPEKTEAVEQSASETTAEGSQPSEPSGTQASESALEKTGFKWGADAPKELQGKTPTETLQMIQQQQDAIRTFLSQNQQQQQRAATNNQRAAQQRQAQQMSNSLKDIGELMYSEPEKALQQYGNIMQGQIGSQVGQAMMPLYRAQADAAKSIARSEDRETWDKYGDEIDSVVNNLPLAQRSNPEAYRAAVKVVKGNHIDEIAAERAQQLAAAASSGLEGGHSAGSAPVGGGNKYIEALRESDYGKQLVDKYGESGMLRKMESIQRADGTSPAEYVKMVANTAIERNPNNAGEWYNKTVGVRRERSA